MAQQTTADAALLTIYKTWYTDKRFPNLLFRNSPTMKKIQKNRFQGKSYNFAALYGRGGASGGDFNTVATIAASSSSKNIEFSVTPGNIFSVFTVTQKEILASQSKQGAYVKALINRMFAATEGARKLLAASLFGWGYGDVGVLPTYVASGTTGTTGITMNWDTIVKLDVGMQFSVCSGGTNNGKDVPGGTYGGTTYGTFESATTRTITSINGQTVYWTGATFVNSATLGSYICVAGGNDATSTGGGAFNMPVGFAQWLPSYANRGQQTLTPTWSAYATTAYYGVTRSIDAGKLMGWFYQRGSGETYSDAIVNGLKLARRGGGIPDMIVVNDDDFSTIITELTANTTYYQMINSLPEKGGQNEVTRGISAFRAAYSKSFVEVLYEDPYCPKGVAYIIDTEAVEFVALNNIAAADDSIPNNEPGTQSVESASEPDTTFKLMIDDYLNVSPPTTNSAEGPAAQVSLAFYGNWVVHEAGHCAIVAF